MSGSRSIPKVEPPGMAADWMREVGGREERHQGSRLDFLLGMKRASFSSIMNSQPRLDQFLPGKDCPRVVTFIPASVTRNVYQCLPGEPGPLVSPLCLASRGLCGSGTFPPRGSGPQSILTAPLHPDASFPSLSGPRGSASFTAQCPCPLPSRPGPSSPPNEPPSRRQPSGPSTKVSAAPVASSQSALRGWDVILPGVLT